VRKLEDSLETQGAEKPDPIGSSNVSVLDASSFVSDPTIFDEPVNSTSDKNIMYDYDMK